MALGDEVAVPAGAGLVRERNADAGRNPAGPSGISVARIRVNLIV
jgi:hypothetical protein